MSALLCFFDLVILVPLKDIILSIGFYFMRNGFTESSGIHIVIEESKKSPSILSNGISIQPGTETNIGLKLSTLSRLKSPFSSDCADEYHWEELKNIKFLRNFEYSSKHCKSWCYMVEIHATCGCYELSLMEGMRVRDFIDWNTNFNLTVCEQRDGSPQSACVRSVLYSKDQSFLIKKCKCHAECSEVEYKVTKFQFYFIPQEL